MRYALRERMPERVRITMSPEVATGNAGISVQFWYGQMVPPALC